MTTLTVDTATPRDRHSVPTVVLAGVAWPVYKLQALATAAIVAVVVGAVTRSGEITVWAVAVAAVAVWWTARRLHTRGRAQNAGAGVIR